MVLLLVIPGLTLPSPADAQTASVEKEVQEYRLTMPKVQQMAAVFKAIGDLDAKAPKTAVSKAEAELERLQAKQDPTDAELARMEALQEQIDEADEGDDDTDISDAETIADMARMIDRHPQYAAAVRQAGMTTREFATAQLAYMQAAMAYGLQKAGLLKTLPAGFNAENVKFFQQHEAELTKLFGDLGQKP